MVPLGSGFFVIYHHCGGSSVAKCRNFVVPKLPENLRVFHWGTRSQVSTSIAVIGRKDHSYNFIPVHSFIRYQLQSIDLQHAFKSVVNALYILLYIVRNFELLGMFSRN